MVVLVLYRLVVAEPRSVQRCHLWYNTSINQRNPCHSDLLWMGKNPFENTRTRALHLALAGVSMLLLRDCIGVRRKNEFSLVAEQ
jgi:hypothetical protein